MNPGKAFEHSGQRQFSPPMSVGPARVDVVVGCLAAHLSRFTILVAQVALLCFVSHAGHQVVALLHLPLPGNLAGLLIMFLMLYSGVLPIRWIERGGALLLRHLSLFFIPLAVGLESFGNLLGNHGLAILAVLFASAALGFLVTGRVAQTLSRLSPRINT